MRYFFITGLLIAFNVSFAQTEENVVKKNEESIKRLKERISEIESSEKLITTEESSSLRIEILNDSIEMLNSVLNSCRQHNGNATNAFSKSSASSQKIKKGETSILFQKDVYKLSQSTKKAIDSFYTSLPKDYSYLVIEGHSDQLGGASLKERISRYRAISVKEYLIEKHKVSENKILLNWYGSKAQLSQDNSGLEDRRCVVSYL